MVQKTHHPRRLQPPLPARAPLNPVDQQEMGRMAGVSRQTISQIERGDYSPSVTLALKLAKLCGVAVEDIFTYREDGDHEDKD